MGLRWLGGQGGVGDRGMGVGDVNQELEVLLKSIKVLYNI